MRVFVCEFVTGGGFVDLPSGLCREGDMMLRALVKDLAALPGVAVVAARDRRLPDPALPARVAWLDPGCEPWHAWAAHVAEADAVWPIAPETDGVLERLSALVRAAGRVLLGSTPEAVRVAASKRATAELLAAQGLP
ncbi:MAG: hypothetical protein IRY94_15930, partial [Rhodospirillaceae bacterium]|nr:hypothetical protein [Rhodospirillaceae bacterium]